MNVISGRSIKAIQHIHVSRDSLSHCIPSVSTIWRALKLSDLSKYSSVQSVSGF